ncbi:SDR family NAD(P)-dependent oxidoreductase [Maritimibacter sp. UBA3975]|uniref:SDR family NAD(P)-dependent oxidoreductase n=1 Tax=Maritimibacter sp. UBA3975 TaxID=1946833 RepID=UPI000C0B8785|nr:SDR family NAD(P)-dependent oxidoreductase [Maritimibacter sp. UBA3975]MAM63389.1 short-chain dehydrogenase [Maritimibacter sp.]
MTKPLPAKRYWLVGASEGLGRSLAEALDARGASLVLSARSEDRLKDLAAGMRDATVVPVDVTDPKSVSDAAQKAGDFDGFIYSVGAYEPMKSTEWNGDAARMMVATNITGCLNVLGEVVPRFVEKNTGHIALIGSLSGFRGLPGALGYGLSKAAVMHTAENLRIDLSKTDILIQRMNPGFIKTRLTEKNEFNMPQLMEPEAAADHVIRAIDKRTFSYSFPKPFSLMFTVGQHLPISWFQGLFKGLV